MPGFDSLLMRTLLAFVLLLLTGGLAWGIRPVINAVLGRLLPSFSHWGATAFQLLIVLGGLTLATISTSIEAVVIGTTPIVTFTLGMAVGGRRSVARSVTMRQQDNVTQDNATQGSAVTDEAVDITSSTIVMGEGASAVDLPLTPDGMNENHMLIGNATEPPTDIAPIAAHIEDGDEEPATPAQTVTDLIEDPIEQASSWQNTLLNRTALPLMRRTPLGKRTVQALFHTGR